MPGAYTEIDMTTWKRAIHCQIFRESIEPQYCITFELDITHFLARMREQGHSLTFGLVYAVTRCANEIEEFRYRFWTEGWSCSTASTPPSPG